MTNRIIAFALALGFAIPATADDRLVRFDGGIGVIPTGSANNTVRGVAARRPDMGDRAPQRRRENRRQHRR